MEVSGQLHGPGALPPEKEPRYPGPIADFVAVAKGKIIPSENRTPVF